MVRGLLWGEDVLPPEAGTGHFLVVGASGSGKTVLIERFLWSLFGNPHSLLSEKKRAILYDPKQEIVSILYGMGQAERVRILHPFDSRSYAWNLAADIDGPISARQAATLLVPDHPGTSNDSFFDNAVRDLITGVILTFINCAPNPAQWTLRDVLLSLLYEPNLRFVLSHTQTRTGEPFPLASRLRSYVDSEQSDPRTVANIRASINARLSIYEPIAAVWEEARKQGQTFSLKQWIRGDEILVLGNDESARTALDAINQLLFKRMTEIILSQPEIDETAKEIGEGYTYVILDEVREAGRLDGLSRLLTKGRSKGACVVLGFQDIDGLSAVFGKEVAQEITGQSQNIAILQVSSPSTAEWAASLFGKFLHDVSSASRSYDQQGRVNIGETSHETDRPLVFSGDLIYLPKTSPNNGLTGYFRSPHRDRIKDGIKVHLHWASDIAPYLPRAAEVPNFEPRPVEQHYLKPWDGEDWKRLGFPGSPPPWQEDQEEKTSSSPQPPSSSTTKGTNSEEHRNPDDSGSFLHTVRRKRLDDTTLDDFE